MPRKDSASVHSRFHTGQCGSESICSNFLGSSRWKRACPKSGSRKSIFLYEDRSSSCNFNNTNFHLKYLGGK